jgi:hypothetical protein
MIAGWIMAGSAINGVLGNPIGNLFSGSSPSNVSTSGTQTTQLPSWYTAYMQGALGTGQQLASNPYPAYSGQQIAPFNDTQQTAFSNINNAQGSWAPTMNTGLSTAASVPTTASNAGTLANLYGYGAVGSASQPVQSWTNPGVASQWMSPYMSQVTDAIAQQGNQNWNQNIMPGIEAQFIAGGNPNSSQNAAALGVGAADVQKNISALQAQALQQGYQGAMTGQQTAAGQALQQQLGAATTGLGAASTALGGGTLGTTAGLGAAGALQTGAQAGQTMTYNDIAQLLAAGNQQQGLAQTADTTAYNQFMNQAQYPQTQLSWLNSIATGAQLPTSTNATGNAPLAGATYGPSPASLGYAAYNTLNSSPNPSGISSALTNASINSSLAGNPTSTIANPPGAKKGGLIAVTKKYSKGGKVSPLAAATKPRKPVARKGPSPLAACSGGGV